ncbi:unnamed protein product [Pleuronectes platessa]|uniref:Uncharacterized protein n=1 Tax=Pleuronectes platessa TaxID=8262 RepID=A0A9N7UIS3_PLEPL|nr:unnamed protein product [Pleuronectes platessa]
MQEQKTQHHLFLLGCPAPEGRGAFSTSVPRALFSPDTPMRTPVGGGGGGGGRGRGRGGGGRTKEAERLVSKIVPVITAAEPGSEDRGQAAGTETDTHGSPAGIDNGTREGGGDSEPGGGKSR